MTSTTTTIQDLVLGLLRIRRVGWEKYRNADADVQRLFWRQYAREAGAAARSLVAAYIELGRPDVRRIDRLSTLAGVSTGELLAAALDALEERRADEFAELARLRAQVDRLRARASRFRRRLAALP